MKRRFQDTQGLSFCDHTKCTHATCGGNEQIARVKSKKGIQFVRTCSCVYIHDFQHFPPPGGSWWWEAEEVEEVYANEKGSDDANR